MSVCDAMGCDVQQIHYVSPSASAYCCPLSFPPCIVRSMLRSSCTCVDTGLSAGVGDSGGEEGALRLRIQ